ncbi:MAG: hypothetical protein ABI824_16065, partial [Acidobacteriota bacterium]
MRRLLALWLVVPLLLMSQGWQPIEQRTLEMPVQGIKLSDIHDTFDQARGGERRHQATDIMSPRNTPVLAVED